MAPPDALAWETQQREGCLSARALRWISYANNCVDDWCLLLELQEPFACTGTAVGMHDLCKETSWLDDMQAMLGLRGCCLYVTNFAPLRVCM